jgi:hypothetical protein
VSNCKDLEIKLPNTSRLMTKNLKGILKTCVSPTLKYQSVQGSTSQLNGSSNSTLAISSATQPMMAHVTHPTSSQSTLPLSRQMTHQPDQYPTGSAGCSWDPMPNSTNWLNTLTKWMTGELLPTSFDTKNTMKNTRKSTQKSISSSWTPPLLSKIVPYVNNASRHPGALKVSLTSKGWVPSPPVPSEAYILPIKKTTMTEPSPGTINVGADSEGEVMKQPSGLVMEDD